MAVPRGDNGFTEEEIEEENAFLEQNSVVDLSDHSMPSHLDALASAAQSGDVVALRTAIDNLDGKVDEPLEDNDTALHLACLYGHLSCVQLLVERGANMEVKDEDEAIPLHDACAGGYLEIVELLLNRASGPEAVKRMIDTIDVEGDTPLHHAARGEHVDVIRFLLGSGASPTTENSYGKTPVELAEINTDARRVLEDAIGNSTMSS